MERGAWNHFHKKRDWENHQVTSINREKAHAIWHAYATEEEAVAYGDSSNRMSLDGVWDFAFLENPDAFHEELLQGRGTFQKICVPGNWELQGFGKPAYGNMLYPFLPAENESFLCPVKRKQRDIHEDYYPPYVPKRANNVGVYLRSFVLPDHFYGKDIFIRFGGVESAFYLWINGAPVGYSQDAKLPAEFNITSYITCGENRITVEVLQFSDGTWLECQDNFYLSGIFRPVDLIAKPKQHIEDFYAKAVPAEAGKGKVFARLTINKVPFYTDYTAKVSLYNARGALLFEQFRPFQTLSPLYAKWRYIGPSVKTLPQTADFEFEMENIEYWSCDRPVLYTMVFSLIDGDGEVIDRETARIGFRSIGIQDNVIKLNGKRFVFRGVNRHEWAWPDGRTVSREHMIKEIRLMKEMNINAVRCSHYPDSPEWYDLCDEYGLCVVCEANVETHGVYGKLTNDPEWAGAMLERVQRMACYFRNHPSIVSWSLGNESGYGPNHAAMANWLREFDDSRLVQYESCDPGDIASDIKCSMYPSPSVILQMTADNSDRRPIVLVEYGYQISNSGGGLAWFPYFTENYEIFQGGFIWDWQDKCLPVLDSDGKKQFGYAGDRKEEFIDWEIPAYMVANGIVLPDLTPKPCAYELKQVLAPVIIEKKDDTFILKNRYHALDTTTVECFFQLLENGVGIHEAILELPRVLPGEDAPLAFTIPDISGNGGERFLNFTFLAGHSHPFLPPGYVICQYQFPVCGNKVRKEDIPEGMVVLVKRETEFQMDAGKASVCIDRKKGVVKVYKDHVLQFEGGEENVLRGRSGLCLEEKWDGDVQKDWEKIMEGKLKRTVLSVEAFQTLEMNCAGVIVNSSLSNAEGGIHFSTQYRLNAAGQLRVDIVADVDSCFRSLARIGVSYCFPEGFEDISWYGRGPYENYSDRHACALVGLYQSTVEKMHFPFVPPSHNGTHIDTRWVSITHPELGTVTFEGANFSFDVHHYRVKDLWEAKHEYELDRRRETYLYIDGLHSGIGGDMAWSTEIPARHLVLSGQHRFGFKIRI